MEEFIISAKPHPNDVNLYNFIVHDPKYNEIDSNLVNITGKSFWNIRNVYLSSQNYNIFNTPVTFYNPFSSVSNLSLTNIGFYGIELNDYIVLSDKMLTFSISGVFNQSGYFDVIIENEAGFGILSRDSYVPFISSFKDEIDIQKPCVSGIYISYIS